MSERIKKINEVLQRELGRIILKEIDLPRSTLVTLMRVETAKDLTQAKVFVSVLPQEETEKVLAILNKNSYHFHQLLNDKLFIRKVPKIKFVEERELSQAHKVDKLLDEIEKEEQSF